MVVKAARIQRWEVLVLTNKPKKSWLDDDIYNPKRDGPLEPLQSEPDDPCHGPQDTVCPSCGLGQAQSDAEPVAIDDAKEQALSEAYVKGFEDGRAQSDARHDEPLGAALKRAQEAEDERDTWHKLANEALKEA